jgi:hypothetical protein
MFAVAVLAEGGACSSRPRDTRAEGTWVGTVTTDGNVTTVVNEGGSMWGGTATLVEEASIGVEAGADEYMFGFINSLYANDDRMVILDEHTNIVREYDHAGQFLFNVGGEGQGPGEYTDAIILTMDSAGRTFVFDIGNYRLTEYAPSGGYVTSWRIPDFGCCAWIMHPQPLGLLWVPVAEVDRDTRERRYGARLYGGEGPVGEVMWVPEIEFEAATHEADGREIPAPFSARVIWYPTPEGGIIAGANDRYRFEVVHPDGSKTAVERIVAPTPIDSAEREWQRRLTVATWRGRLENWDWDGAEMPQHKPAFRWFTPAVSGEIWVSRDIGSERLSDCTEDPLEEYSGETSIRPCFRAVYAADVFDSDGRFLGEVELPELRPFVMYANEKVVIGYVEDEAGTIMLKRYRLVLPGRGGR